MGVEGISNWSILQRIVQVENYNASDSVLHLLKRAENAIYGPTVGYSGRDINRLCAKICFQQSLYEIIYMQSKLANQSKSINYTYVFLGYAYSYGLWFLLF